LTLERDRFAGVDADPDAERAVGPAVKLRLSQDRGAALHGLARGAKDEIEAVPFGLDFATAGRRELRPDHPPEFRDEPTRLSIAVLFDVGRVIADVSEKERERHHGATRGHVRILAAVARRA
jgi:hypothetical protein